MKFDSKTKIYVYQKPIDMRFGFERLSYLIKEEMGKNIDVGDVFIFLDNNRRRLKGLRFDGSGLILFSKRMEKKRGFMNVRDLDGCVEMSREEFEFLIHGSILKKYLPLNRVMRNNKIYVTSYWRVQSFAHCKTEFS